MALSEREELELLELEDKSAQPPPKMFHPSGEKNLSFSNPDLLAAHPINRAIKGVAALPLGLLQLVDEAGAGLDRASRRNPNAQSKITEHLKNYEGMVQRGREELGSTGFDWTEAGGAVMQPPVIKGAQLLQKATTLPQKMGVGAVAGALIGGSQPVTAEGDFLGHKAVQTGVGATLGGVIPAGVQLAKNVGTGIGHASDLIFPGGGSRIWNRYIKSIVGEERAPEVIKALEASHNRVPNSEPTAAQAVSGVAGGSPVIAAQKITAAVPGGISADFGERFAAQEAARRKVLSDLSSSGTIEQQLVAQALQKKLTTMIHQQPGSKIPDVIGKESPTVFLKALVDNERLVKSVTGIPKPIDQVFNKTQMKRLINVAEELKTNLAMANPSQRTALQGGVNVAEETRTHLPQMLSRPMMLANAVLKFAGHGVEPKVQAAGAKQFLNPQQMAEALKTVPDGEISKMIQAILAQSQAAAPVIAGQQEGR